MLLCFLRLAILCSVCGRVTRIFVLHYMFGCVLLLYIMSCSWVLLCGDVMLFWYDVVCCVCGHVVVHMCVMVLCYGVSWCGAVLHAGVYCVVVWCVDVCCIVIGCDGCRAMVMLLAFPSSRYEVTCSVLARYVVICCGLVQCVCVVYIVVLFA